MKIKKDLVEKTTNLYSNTGWKAVFTKIRFWGAPFEEIENFVPKRGTIIDLGCGEGIFANFLGLSSRRRRVIGIEINEKRLRVAKRGVPNVSFKKGDATKSILPPSDAIVLFHLLHHLNSLASQEKALKNSLKKLNKNGKLIIIEIDMDMSPKFFLTWFVDHFLVPVLFDKKLFEPKIFFRRGNEWVALLRKLGLKCKLFKTDKGKPFSHITLIATRI